MLPVDIGVPFLSFPEDMHYTQSRNNNALKPRLYMYIPWLKKVQSHGTNTGKVVYNLRVYSIHARIRRCNYI